MKVWEDFLRICGWRSEYKSVDRVLRYYSRKVGSERTRENFCTILMMFCRFIGLDPDSLVKLAPSEASRLCQEFTDSLKDRGYSVRYLNACQAYLKTFFKVNGFEGDRALKVERYYQPTRYRKKPEYIPTSEEIYKMGYASGSAKNRAIIFMLYTSGLRNSTLRALRYGDVREDLEKGFDIVRIPVYPEMKKVDPAACKGNIPYYTFMSREATMALKEYLHERIEEYGSINDDEPLFCSDSNNVPHDRRRFTPMSKNGLGRMIKRAAKAAGIKQWMNITCHSLRKAFETALRNNRLDPSDREFLMGHILPGSQDPYYDHTKIEELRKKYAQIVFFPHLIQAEELRKRQIIDMAKLLGFSEDRIKHIEEALAKYATVDEAINEIRKLSLDGCKASNGSSKDPKKIVSEGELEKYLANGWDVQAILPSGRVLIRKVV